ncbi:MAG: hypothetical protein ABI811_02205, partial [Acidobacteriota bacterium]
MTQPAATTLAALLLSAALVPALQAQTPIQLRNNTDHELNCDRNRDFASRFCEMREQTVSSTGRFDIDGLHNGGVTVRGWNRNDVLVRLRVEVDARSDARAKEIVQRIHTEIRSGRVLIDGPDWESFLSQVFDSEGWSVSAEVFVPHRSTIRLGTHNGGVLVTDIDGGAQLASHNGGVRVERVTGEVRGSTHNGGIRIADVGGNVQFESHNGGITLTRIAGSIQGVTHNGGVEVELAGA